MVIVSALAVSIAIHEVLYISRDGGDYLKRCLAPTFGIRLTPGLHSFVHICLIACSIGLALLPESVSLIRICFAALTLVVGSYSLRLSNHLILCWFMLVVLCLNYADESLVRTAIAGLAVITYALGFMHKLNADFLSPGSSCAAQLATFFCQDRKIANPRFIKSLCQFSIAGTLAVEGIIPILLIFPATSIYGLALGLAFHFSLALLGIVNFSAVMYTALLAFVPPGELSAIAHRVAGWGPAPSVAACALFSGLVWRFTPRRANVHCPYEYRWLGWIVQTGFGLVTAFGFLGLIAAMGEPGEAARVNWRAAWGTAIPLVWAVFLLNGMAPYLGLKTEFSFAMFSNLRCDPWRHLFFRSEWRPFRTWHYLDIERMEGLPEPGQLGTDRGALLALRLLSMHNAFRFSACFLRDAVDRIQRTAKPTPRIVLRYREAAESHDVDCGDAAGYSRWRRGPRVNWYPIIMPKNPDEAHSEQGVAVGTGAKQLF